MVICLSIGASASSLAVFTHDESVDGGFTTGTVSLGLVPTDTLITFQGMVPGDEVDGALTILNTGTATLRYAMTTNATDPDTKHLRDALQLVVERRSGCSGPVLETLYSGSIGAAALGNPQPGANSGDRTLGSGISDVLCFRALLPVDTDPLYQGAATTITLTFWAEQTAGNP